LEEAGMTAKADQILMILSKIATGNMHDSLGKPVHDRHTNGLTPEKMTKNLSDHGMMLNLADDGAADDLLDADIDNLEVSDNGDEIFEDTD
jgi:hypothetical protein